MKWQWLEWLRATFCRRHRRAQLAILSIRTIRWSPLWLSVELSTAFTILFSYSWCRVLALPSEMPRQNGHRRALSVHVYFVCNMYLWVARRQWIRVFSVRSDVCGLPLSRRIYCRQGRFLFWSYVFFFFIIRTMPLVHRKPSIYFMCKCMCTFYWLAKRLSSEA